MNIVHIDELDRNEMADGFVWRPVRRHFGIQALTPAGWKPSVCRTGMRLLPRWGAASTSSSVRIV